MEEQGRWSEKEEDTTQKQVERKEEWESKGGEAGEKND